MRYRVKTGFAAWLLMRATGLALTLYLALHVWVLSRLAQGPAAFDRLMGTLQAPLFHALEVLLAAGIVFHAANGVRLILIDFGTGSNYQKPLLWLASAATAGGVGLALWRLLGAA
jgi:succinate dehydrogenase / fumarate reductase cytochrome b subunit